MSVSEASGLGLLTYSGLFPKESLPQDQDSGPFGTRQSLTVSSLTKSERRVRRSPGGREVSTLPASSPPAGVWHKPVFPAPDVPDFHPNEGPLGAFPHVRGPLLLHQRPGHRDDGNHPLGLRQPRRQRGDPGPQGQSGLSPPSPGPLSSRQGGGPAPSAPPLPGRRCPIFPPSVLPASWIQGSPQCSEQHPAAGASLAVFWGKEAPGGRLGPAVRALSEAPGRAPLLSASPRVRAARVCGRSFPSPSYSTRGFHVTRHQDRGCPGQDSPGTPG